MKNISRMIYSVAFLLVIQVANAQRKTTISSKDIVDINNSKLNYNLVSPVRCMIDISGISSADKGLFDLQTIRYNTGGKIVIDMNTETITFNASGLYHIEGSFFSFFTDNSPHEIFVDAKIDGVVLEPLDYQNILASNVNYSSASLKFQNDIYFAAGTTFQLTNRYGSMKNIRGFFSANFISQ